VGQHEVHRRGHRLHRSRDGSGQARDPLRRSYQRRRQPWGFNGGGPGSGIWRTTDSGRTWTKLQGAGLPEGIIGRIGLDICRTRPNVIYAQIEVGASAGSGANVTADGKPVQPGAGARPPTPPAPRPAGETPPPDPKRSGVWRSDDKGKTWKLMSNNDNRPMYYSQVRVDPNNPDIVYTCGAPFHKSVDGGRRSGPFRASRTATTTRSGSTRRIAGT